MTMDNTNMEQYTTYVSSVSLVQNVYVHVCVWEREREREGGRERESAISKDS